MMISDRQRTAFKSPYRPVLCRRRGSLTVYFALTFAVMLSLITTAIYSSKVEAGKARLSSAARQSIESVFARYDTTLSDRYHLYFVDGGCGTGSFQTDTVTRFLNQSSAHLLNPAASHVLPGSSFLSFRDSSVMLDGMTMATDLDGMVFRAQAVQSVKDLPVPEPDDNTPGSSLNAGNQPPSRPKNGLYDTPVHQDVSELSESEKNLASSLLRSIISTNSNSKNLLLSFVLEGHPDVSGKTADFSDVLSNRRLNAGFGILDTAGAKEAGNKILFTEYLLRHMNRYDHKTTAFSVLDYETEYLIAGKSSDRQNLKKVMQKLLVKRQGINFLYVETDPYMHAAVTHEAANMALILLQPELEPMIQSALASAWAMAESLADLRSLYSGNRIARIKSADTWQVSLEDLAGFSSGSAFPEIDVPGGINYREALQSLLLYVPVKKLTFRAMDLIEDNIRKSGRPSFSFDLCFDAMHLTLHATVQQDVPVSASACFSFRNRK